MIAVCSNPFRDENLELAQKCISILESSRYQTCLYKVFVDEILNVDNVDMAVVIGGDGTILKVAGLVHRFNIPILGVNLGTKGFMTAIDPENIELILNAVRGECTVSSRMMLDVYLNDEYVGACLNDAVVHGFGDCISLSTYCDNTQISTISGDGIVISTPTGSTGYSMSAGGPVVEPEAKCIIVSPICAHCLGSRSFVLDESRTVRVEAEKLHVRKAYLSLDGNINIDLNNHDIVTAKKSEYCTKMVSLNVKSFYDIAFEKLT